MPFARFMDLALYDPAGGYYRGPDARPGRTGDFLTAPEAHPIFGRAVARVLDEAWRRLGEPARFVVREYGAGDGTLGARHPRWPAARRSGLERRDRLRPGRGRAPPGRGDRHRAWPRPDGRAPSPGRRTSAGRSSAPSSGTRSSTRCRSIASAGETARLVELAVGLDGDRLVEVEIEPTTPALAERLAVGGHRPRRRADGGDLPRARRLDRRRGRGPGARDSLLLIDYGAAATELYDPVRRRDGTLRAYVRHRVHDDPYRHVGRQDLTAHVDVTAVERAAAVAGLEHLGDADAGRVPRRGRHRRAPARDPVGPRDIAGGVPRGPLGADADAGSGRDGSVPGHGIRARLARRSAAGRVRLPPAGTAAPLRDGNADGIAAGDHTGLGRCTYCRPFCARRAGFASVGHDLTGSGARTCTRARRAPLPDASFTALAGCPRPLADTSLTSTRRPLPHGFRC